MVNGELKLSLAVLSLKHLILQPWARQSWDSGYPRSAENGLSRVCVDPWNPKNVKPHPIRESRVYTCTCAVVCATRQHMMLVRVRRQHPLHYIIITMAHTHAHISHAVISGRHAALQPLTMVLHFAA